MPIYHLIQKSALSYSEAAIVSEAYERSITALGITDRCNPVLENVAAAILHMFRDGETDPIRLSQMARRAVKLDVQPSHPLELPTTIQPTRCSGTKTASMQ